MNPDMRNEKLRGVFSRPGFTNVRTAITGGNVLFGTDDRSLLKLEAAIEKALPEQPGFPGPVINRNRKQLQGLVAS